MEPMFSANEAFSKADKDKWTKYIEWSGLEQLEEVISLDSMLCPNILKTIEDDYWPHLSDDGRFFNVFKDFEFLVKQLEEKSNYNLLGLLFNPTSAEFTITGKIKFEFVGYDLIEVDGGISALTNCGGFPKAFKNKELNKHGLIHSFSRAKEVQSDLRKHYPEESHADCNLWAIGRASTQN